MRLLIKINLNGCMTKLLQTFDVLLSVFFFFFFSIFPSGSLAQSIVSMYFFFFLHIHFFFRHVRYANNRKVRTRKRAEKSEEKNKRIARKPDRSLSDVAAALLCVMKHSRELKAKWTCVSLCGRVPSSCDLRRDRSLGFLALSLFFALSFHVEHLVTLRASLYNNIQAF